MGSLLTWHGAALAASVFGLLAGVGTAQASETRGFVVSWFYPSAAAQDSAKDCPHGMNPNAATNVIHMLEAQGRKPDEIAKLMDSFPQNVYGAIGMRGRINGKPANPYVNPVSVPDPKLKTVEGKIGRGFNLDGQDTPDGFYDPETGEHGVDNQLFRVYGCTGVMRAEPTTRPSWPSAQWSTVQRRMPAWLIEVSGIDDLQNDPDVEVRVVQATAPVVLDANSETQADMTYVENNNPVTKNKVHGAIKNGMLLTDPFNLSLNGDRWAWQEMRFKEARLRLKFQADGSAKGYVGGWHKWLPLYLQEAEGGAYYETLLSIDLSGLYYSFRKLADRDPDPQTGINTTISTAFTIEAVPAYIIHPGTQTAAPTPAPSGRTMTDVPAAPPGITIRVIRIGINPRGSNSNQSRDHVVFADDKNKVLYTWDKDTVPGKSLCNGECAKTWIPAVVKEGTQPTGYWSIIARDDGTSQWAFRGHAMYTYAPEANPPNTPIGAQERAEADPAAKPQQVAAARNDAQIPVRAGADVAKPKNGDTAPEAAAAAPSPQVGEGKGHEVDGHRVAEILPKSWIETPAGIGVQEVRTAPGYVLVDAKGLPLYVFDGKPGDSSVDKEWAPFVAPQASKPKVGEFTIISRPDSGLQWAFKGKPLYKYRGDLDYGDSNGQYADKRFQLVYELHYFLPPNVVVRKDRTYGGRLALADGRSLFARDQNFGSDEGIRSDRGHLQAGERFGLSGCDAKCEQDWQPLVAAADAQPQGYWTLYDRPDGKKQWAYYGYALYAHAGGEVASTEIFDKVELFEPLKDGGARPSMPLHWRVAPP